MSKKKSEYLTYLNHLLFNAVYGEIKKCIQIYKTL